MFQSLYRHSLLTVADSSPIKTFMSRQGWKLGVSRFVAGETLEEALVALHALEKDGLYGILDLLGEFVDTQAGVDSMRDEIRMTLERLKDEPLDRYMSVKPTQLGAGISFDLLLQNARELAERAREIDAHVCFDMENVPYVDKTLDLYRALHGEGFRNVSTVLQSYLYRTRSDLEGLLTLEPKPTLRIVKGAYRESDKVAMQNKADVDASYRDLVYMGLEGGAKINVATHDESILQDVASFARGAKLTAERYEFQLLYGVKLKLQRRLREQGHFVRIYVPYGQDWYGYFSRRLAERPANLLFVLRGMVG